MRREGFCFTQYHLSNILTDLLEEVRTCTGDKNLEFWWLDSYVKR